MLGMSNSMKKKFAYFLYTGKVLNVPASLYGVTFIFHVVAFCWNLLELKVTFIVYLRLFVTKQNYIYDDAQAR